MEESNFNCKTNDSHHIPKKTTLRGSMTTQNLSSGLISSIMVMTGPAVIILEAANAGGFTSSQTISWMFAVYFFGGLFGIVMSLIYKIPITGGHSITGVAFLATVTSQFSYSQLIGGYIMSGLIIYLAGVLGLFAKMIQWIPREVIAAMLAGLITSYVVGMIPAVEELPFIGGSALFVFLILTKLKSWFPPVMAAVVTAFLVLFLTDGLHVASVNIPFSIPFLQMPEFTWVGLITVSLPLALLILSNDAAPAIGALESAEYNPPVRKIISASGLFSMLAALFGGQSANIAGMMTAICASPASGPKTKRYFASIVSGVIILLFGIFAWKIAPFIQTLPSAFVSLLVGLALIGALQSSLYSAFSVTRYRLSALAAFVISLSDISFLHVSSPVWALVIGAVVAWTIENHSPFISVNKDS